MTSKTTNFTFRLPTELKQKFVKEAKANGTTATALFHQWMEDYINGKKPSTDDAQTTSTYSTDNAQTISTDNALTDKLDSLESRVNELSEANEYQAQQQKATTNYLNQLRDRVDKLEKWKDPIRDNLQANYDSISKLKAKVEALEDSTDTAHTDSTNNNKSPASEEKDGGIVAQQRNGEATIPQPQDKIRQHSTDSTDTAHTEETEGSTIAPLTQEALAKRLNISGRGLANHREKGNEHLMEWSRERDPDGIAWKYENKKYRPA